MAVAQPQDVFHAHHHVSSVSKRFVAAGILGLLLLLGGLLCFRSGGRGRVPIGLLSDGTPVFLEAVTYGTNHALSSMGSLRRLANDLDLVPTWARWTVGAWSHSGSPTLGVWISQPTAHARTPHLRLSVVDPEGLVAVENHPRAKGYRGRTFIRGFAIGQFPRRDAVLRLRVDEFPAANVDKAVPRRVGEVRFANPGLPPVSNWVPEPLPVTRKKGEATFTLKSVESWKEGGHWVTRVVLETSGARRVIGALELRDAAGNRLTQPGEHRGLENRLMNEQWMGSTLTVSSRGALSAREPAWKVRFLFAVSEGQPMADTVEFLVPPCHVEPPPGPPVFTLLPIDELEP